MLGPRARSRLVVAPARARPAVKGNRRRRADGRARRLAAGGFPWCLRGRGEASVPGDAKAVRPMRHRPRRRELHSCVLVSHDTWRAASRTGRGWSSRSLLAGRAGGCPGPGIERVGEPRACSALLARARWGVGKLGDDNSRTGLSFSRRICVHGLVRSGLSSQPLL